MTLSVPSVPSEVLLVLFLLWSGRRGLGVEDDAERGAGDFVAGEVEADDVAARFVEAQIGEREGELENLIEIETVTDD